MLTPYTDRQKTLIVNNLILACQDISKLNKTGYQFISCASGFIAHYNHSGFICAYNSGKNLKHDILQNQRYNQSCNYSPCDKNYEYCMSKREIYNRVCEGIRNVSI